MKSVRARPEASLFFLSAIAFAGIEPAARELLSRMGVTGQSFSAFVQRVNAQTAEREREGEGDHLIYYVLQSKQFTSATPIEPALSAKAFVETGSVPAPVLRRFQDFLSVRVAGDRLIYLRGMIPSTGGLAFLKTEYARAMRSLYAKEFESKPGFYQTRGHSTDTQVPANYAVWTALSALHAEHPGLTLNRVLVVGPGLDFAPRTGLDDRFPPQSYQPYAIVDALLSTGLSAKPAVHCVDINDRVVRFLRQKPGVLHLTSPPGDADYLAYFRELGAKIGTAKEQGIFEKELVLKKEIAESVTAEKANIITEYPAGPPASYDLVVATNVLLYFSDAELLLALSNIAASLRRGAFLLHNEMRPNMETLLAAAGLVTVESRSVRVASGSKAALYDVFNLVQKRGVTPQR